MKELSARNVQINDPFWSPRLEVTAQVDPSALRAEFIPYFCGRVADDGMGEREIEANNRVNIV